MSKNILTHYRNNREQLESNLFRMTRAVKLLLFTFVCLAIAVVATFVARLFGAETSLPSDFVTLLLFLFCCINGMVIWLNRLEIIRDILDDGAATNE